MSEQAQEAVTGGRALRAVLLSRLERIGGWVRLHELTYQLRRDGWNLDEDEVADALFSLEDAGKVRSSIGFRLR